MKHLVGFGILIKVTLGLVVKNAEKTLQETIGSVLIQDFPHEFLEVVIVDGMSQDKTMSIAMRGLRKSDIAFSTFATKKGLGFSRQIVVDNAVGKYIIMVDGDVVLPKNFVRKQVIFMEKNPKAGIGTCYYAYRDGPSWIANVENMLQVTGQARAIAIYRKDALKNVGGFDPEIKGACEDVDVGTRMLAAGWPLVDNHDVRIWHNFKDNTRDFLRRAEWYGFGVHFTYHKNKNLGTGTPLWAATPIVGLAYGLKKTMQAWKLERKKEAFLIPALVFVERIAWWFGFLKSHMLGYGHNQA